MKKLTYGDLAERLERDFDNLPKWRRWRKKIKKLQEEEAEKIFLSELKTNKGE